MAWLGVCALCGSAAEQEKEDCLTEKQLTPSSNLIFLKLLRFG